MYRLRKGGLKTVIFNDHDLDSYLVAGWKIDEGGQVKVEEPKVEEPKVEEPKVEIPEVTEEVVEETKVIIDEPKKIDTFKKRR